jgi:hypothetical protein
MKMSSNIKVTVVSKCFINLGYEKMSNAKRRLIDVKNNMSAAFESLVLKVT